MSRDSRAEGHLDDERAQRGRLQDEEEILRRVTRVEAEIRELKTRVSLMDKKKPRRVPA